MISARWEAPCRLRIQGHAGYAESGKDIVCAAVSALWGTLNMELDRREKTGQGVHEVADGTVLFRPADNKDEAEIRDIFGMIWGGILLLSTQYGGWIDAKREW